MLHPNTEHVVRSSPENDRSVLDSSCGRKSDDGNEVTETEVSNVHLNGNKTTEYFNNDRRLPYLRRGKGTWRSQQLVDLILHRRSNKICTARPLAPQENCSFLVDTSKLDSTDDWKSDDHGSWRNCGSSGRIVTIIDGKVTTNVALPRSKKQRPKLHDNQYLFQTTYYRHLKYADFRRNSVIAFDNVNEQKNLVIIDYFFTGKEHQVSPKKHGNTKTNKKFLPTTASTKKRLNTNLTNTVRGPLSVFDKVSQEVGGLGRSYAASDIPRSVDQVRYMRKTMRQKGETDEISELLDKAHSMPDNVHCLQLTPSIRFVVSNAQTMQNISCFCTQHENCIPFCVDTTYGIGNFFVTTTCYKNLKLLNTNNNEHPTFPGPALFHVDQDTSVFSFFAQTMIACKNDLKSILFIGSDRDKALINGIGKHLLFANNLFCKKHVEDDILRKFSAMPHMKKDARKTILADIFGSEARQTKGLIDSETEKEFDDLCYLCYLKWDKLEKACDSSKVPQFSNYFKIHIEQDMRNGMILCKRRAAGLFDDFFYNNTTESINFRLKNKIKEHKALSEKSGRPSKKCSLSEAVGIYKEFLDEYTRNANRAIIGVGPYKLAPCLEQFFVPQHQWSRLSEPEKERKIAQFNSVRAPLATTATWSDSRQQSLGNMSPEKTTHRDTTTNNVPGPSTLSSTLQTSNRDLMDFSMTGLSKNYEIDWRGAVSILHDKAAMKSPWDSGSYIVRSASNPTVPHAVKFSILNKTAKCDCPRFKFHSICKHSISVAHLEGFVNTFIKKWAPNLSRQTEGTVPERAGQKKNDRGKRVRKPPQHRNIQDYGNPNSQATNSPDDEKLKVVFLETTKARTCYGCGEKFRSKDDVKFKIAPPVPYDIALTRRERRVYRNPGTHTIRISMTAENVYYHPKRKCLRAKVSSLSPAIFNIDQDLNERLTPAHKNLLAAEFKLAL